MFLRIVQNLVHKPTERKDDAVLVRDAWLELVLVSCRDSVRGAKEVGLERVDPRCGTSKLCELNWRGTVGVEYRKAVDGEFIFLFHPIVSLPEVLKCAALLIVQRAVPWRDALSRERPSGRARPLAR